MKVYIVQSPLHDGGNLLEVFSRDGAIAVARRAWKYGDITRADPRSDDEALEEFRIVHWASEHEVLGG